MSAPSRCSPRRIPGLFAADPPPEFVPLLAAIAAEVRRATLRRQLAIMAEAELSDLLPNIAVPTLLIWGEADARFPLTVAYQFQEAIADTKLVLVEGAGHLSNIERPERVNDAVREFCRSHTRRIRGTGTNQSSPGSTR